MSTAPFNDHEPALVIDSSQTKFVKDGNIELNVSLGEPCGNQNERDLDCTATSATRDFKA
jgi:hypothetical protein